MNPVNKIHFNSSTGVSLNDRFTIMSKVSPGLDKAGAALGRAEGHGQGVPSGLRKRSNSVDSIPSRGSLANRAFVSQLDRRHMGGQHSQLRLRNRNIRSGRQKLNRNNISSRVQLRRAAGNTLTLVGGSRRMQRSNSLSDIATMNADFYERHTPLTRSNSQASLAARLGTNRIGRSRSRGGPRGRSLQRNQSRNRSRSNSGIRNGANGLGQGRPSRSRSRGGGNLGNNNGNGNNGVRARSRSAAGYGVNGRGRGGGRPMQRRNSYKPRSVSRSASVNGRLGNNRTSRPMSGGGFRGGRIGKRGMRRGGVYGGGGMGGRNGNNGGRPGRTLQRGRGGPRGGGGAANGGLRRGRSRSRGRAPSQTRGRSAQRGRNASRGRFPAAPQKSKEQLDKELDTYMANTKSSLDKEMDEYMNGIHSATI